MIKFEFIEWLTLESLVEKIGKELSLLDRFKDALIRIRSEYPDAVVIRGTTPGTIAFESRSVHLATDKVDVEALIAAVNANASDVRHLFYIEIQGVRVYSSALLRVADVMAVMTDNKALLDRYKAYPNASGSAV